jgi:ADP-heptose:LPS heptosyltransferase
MKVLLIRLSALGDLVILTSTLELLKMTGAKVFLLTKEEYRELFEGDPRIEDLILLRKGNFLETLKNLRKMTFDYAFDLHKKPLTRLLLNLSRARKKGSYGKRGLERRMAVWFKKRIGEIPVSHLYAEPIKRYMKIDLPVPPPRLLVKTKKMDLPTNYVVLGIGAKYQTKIWPHFGDLAVRIKKEMGITPVLVGDEGDLKETRKIPREAGAIDLVGKTSLKELVGVIKNSKITVSNDSGIAHISAALSVPTVVIFGPTIPAFGFRPTGGRVVLLEYQNNLPCRPCSLHGEKMCKRQDKICLQAISPDYVFSRVKELVKSPNN